LKRTTNLRRRRQWKEEGGGSGIANKLKQIRKHEKQIKTIVIHYYLLLCHCNE